MILFYNETTGLIYGADTGSSDNLLDPNIVAAKERFESRATLVSEKLAPKLKDMHKYKFNHSSQTFELLHA